MQRHLLSCKEEGIFVFENLPSLISSPLAGYHQTFSTKIFSQLVNIYYDLQTGDKSKYLIILSVLGK
ncbi:MAG: hypothetical protein IGS39_04365 [Calothrix sp. C42_A2020_038]|nr:hypothetical protein [Calothrix sp. C42_A2020_038]